MVCNCGARWVPSGRQRKSVTGCFQAARASPNRRWRRLTLQAVVVVIIVVVVTMDVIVIATVTKTTSVRHNSPSQRWQPGAHTASGRRELQLQLQAPVPFPLQLQL